MAALFGQFVGATLALGGIAYIWLGLLWAIRVYKRWPRASYWSAAAVAIFFGAITGASSDQPVLYTVVTIVVCAFVLVRERRVNANRGAAVTTSS